MKKQIVRNLPVIATQFTVFAAILLLTLSLGHAGNTFRYNAIENEDYLKSLEINELEELELMEDIVNKENDLLYSAPYTVKVYSPEGGLVYEESLCGSGFQESKRLRNYIRTSSFMMEVANEHYYLLKK